MLGGYFRYFSDVSVVYIVFFVCCYFKVFHDIVHFPKHVFGSMSECCGQ